MFIFLCHCLFIYKFSLKTQISLKSPYLHGLVPVAQNQIVLIQCLNGTYPFSIICAPLSDLEIPEIQGIKMVHVGKKDLKGINLDHFADLNDRNINIFLADNLLRPYIQNIERFRVPS